MFCRQCGTSLDSDAEYCEKCGTRTRKIHKKVELKKICIGILICAVLVLVFWCVNKRTIKTGTDDIKNTDAGFESYTVETEEIVHGDYMETSVEEEVAFVNYSDLADATKGYETRINDLLPEMNVIHQFVDDFDGDGLFECFVTLSNEQYEDIYDYDCYTGKLWFMNSMNSEEIVLDYGGAIRNVFLEQLHDGTKCLQVSIFYSNIDSSDSFYVVEKGQWKHKGDFMNAGIEEGFLYEGGVIVRNEDGSISDEVSGFVKYKYENGKFVSISEEEFEQPVIEVDGYCIESYEDNLNPFEYKKYESDYAGFYFSYPTELYNTFQINCDEYDSTYGKNIQEIHFKGTDDSQLVFSIVRRDDTYSISEMTEFVYEIETSSLIDSEDVIYRKDDDSGRVIVTGWNPEYPERAIYDMVKIEKDYIMQMKVYLSPYSSEEDKIQKAYYVECLYRLCGFSGTEKNVRSYDEYLKKNS